LIEQIRPRRIVALIRTTGEFVKKVCSRYLNLWAILFLFSFAFYSCSDQDVEPQPPQPPGDQLTAYQREVLNYFVDVALGFEFGNASRITRKWKTEIKIFIGGDKTIEMLTELDRIIGEIEDLTDQLSFSITEDTLQSNYYLFLGSGEEFAKRFPPAQQHIASNWGLFYVYFNGASELYSAVMYVDVYRTNSAAGRKHLLREEFTQSLGLARDSDKYPQSIFYGPWTTVTEYASIDRDLIRVLYHPAMVTGLNELSVRNLFSDLLDDLGI
jgi:hypothetical protein